MKVFTIIVTYNATRNNWLQKCLDSLLKSSMKTEIVVIDNLSKDQTVDIIREKYPSVHLIENKENKGFGGANNQGIKYALDQGAEFFFLLNQDAWVEENTLEKLVFHLKSNPEYGILSPLHLNGLGNALDYGFSTYVRPDRCLNLYSDFVLNKVEDKIYESKFICAAAWMISKDCLKKVGGFNPSFYHYGEDDNYYHRLVYKGLKIGVYPWAKIFHDRQDRELNPFQEGKIVKERALYMVYSNPNNPVDHFGKIQKINRKILKTYLLFDFSEVKALKAQKVLLEKIYKDSHKNLEKSMSSEEFLFLQ